MKFFDINRRDNPNKLNLVALFFVIIAIAGVFLSVRDVKETPQKKDRVEALKKIASDTTIKNIDVRYKTADPGKFSKDENLPGTSQYTQKFYQTMITVSVLFILFFIVVYLLKKKNKISFKGGENIKIIDRKYLGQKQYLTTVIVEHEKLLLGVTEHSINLIKNLGNIENPTQEEPKSSETEDETSFPKVLGKLNRNTHEN